VEISDEIYSFFATYVFKHTGIEYQKHDYYRLDSRIKSLIDHYKCETAEVLYKKCKAGIDQSMHNYMVDLFTNNETYFMRDIKPFKSMGKAVIPMLKELFKNPMSIKIWSCASSTGQEIYSIQMAVDSFGDPADSKLLRIDASDISDDALRRAKEGSYSALEVQRGLPAPFLIKYFTKLPNSENWAIKPDLKTRANFFKFNLLSGIFPVNKYHIIFCRNVLIYQNQENKRKILTDITQALKPGGILVFGAGESLIGMKLPLKHIEIEGAWFYQKTE
jgi:chemotaxis protein methyltransferase CheR